MSSPLVQLVRAFWGLVALGVLFAVLPAAWVAARRLFATARFRSFAQAQSLESGVGALPVTEIRWGLAEVLIIFGFHFFTTAAFGGALELAFSALRSEWLSKAYPQSVQVADRLVDVESLPELGVHPLGPYLIANVAAALVTLLAVSLVVRRGSSPPSALGLERGPRRSELGWLLLLFVGFLLLCQLVRVVWQGVLERLGLDVSSQLSVSTFLDAVRYDDHLWVLLLGFNAVCIAPVLEELLYRGLLHGWLSKKLGFCLAASISAGIFALIHVTPLVLLPIYLLGLLLAALYERRGSLYECILFHAVFNSVTLVVGWLLVKFLPDLLSS